MASLAILTAIGPCGGEKKKHTQLVKDLLRISRGQGCRLQAAGGADSPHLRVDLAGQFQGPQVGGVSALVLLHRVADEAEATRLHAVHHPRRKDHLLGLGDAHHPGQPLGAACTPHTHTHKAQANSWSRPSPPPQLAAASQACVLANILGFFFHLKGQLCLFCVTRRDACESGEARNQPAPGMMASLVSTRPILAELAGEDQEERITQNLFLPKCLEHWTQQSTNSSPLIFVKNDVMYFKY